MKRSESVPPRKPQRERPSCASRNLVPLDSTNSISSSCSAYLRLKRTAKRSKSETCGILITSKKFCQPHSLGRLSYNKATISAQHFSNVTGTKCLARCRVPSCTFSLANVCPRQHGTLHEDNDRLRTGTPVVLSHHRDVTDRSQETSNSDQRDNRPRSRAARALKIPDAPLHSPNQSALRSQKKAAQARPVLFLCKAKYSRLPTFTGGSTYSRRSAPSIRPIGRQAHVIPNRARLLLIYALCEPSQICDDICSFFGASA